MRPLALLVLLVVVPGTGCLKGVPVLKDLPAIQGSGVARDETRKVAEFTGIDVSGIIEATIRLGEETTVRISGDDNIVPLVRTEVRDRRLTIEMKESNPINPKRPLKAEITTPRLDRIGASGAVAVRATVGHSERFEVHAGGASRVTVEGIKADKVDFEASGASQLTAEGSAHDLKVVASGASQVHAEKLAAEAAEARVSGASNAKVRAVKAVRGDASGASRIHVVGRPETKAVATSGASSVQYEAER